MNSNTILVNHQQNKLSGQLTEELSIYAHMAEAAAVAEAEGQGGVAWRGGAGVCITGRRSRVHVWGYQSAIIKPTKCQINLSFHRSNLQQAHCARVFTAVCMCAAETYMKWRLLCAVWHLTSSTLFVVALRCSQDFMRHWNSLNLTLILLRITMCNIFALNAVQNFVFKWVFLASNVFFCHSFIRIVITQ